MLGKRGCWYLFWVPPCSRKVGNDCKGDRDYIFTFILLNPVPVLSGATDSGCLFPTFPKPQPSMHVALQPPHCCSDNEFRTPTLSQDSEVKLSVVELLASLVYLETLFRWKEEPMVPGVLGLGVELSRGLACVFLTRSPGNPLASRI